MHMTRFSHFIAMSEISLQVHGIVSYKSQKFSEGKQAHVGMEASKTNQTRWE